MLLPKLAANQTFVMVVYGPLRIDRTNLMTCSHHRLRSRQVYGIELLDVILTLVQIHDARPLSYGDFFMKETCVTNAI